jgi:hypothetical protein
MSSRNPDKCRPRIYPTPCSRTGHIASLFLSVPSYVPPFLARQYKTHLTTSCIETLVTSLQNLFSCHNLPALGTFLFKTRASQLVRFSFTAFGADAVSTGASSKTTSSTATPTTSPHASPCSGPLASWSCSISSGHFHHLLLRNWPF